MGVFHTLVPNVWCEVKIPALHVIPPLLGVGTRPPGCRFFVRNGTAVQTLVGAARQLLFTSHGGRRSHGGDVVGLVGSNEVACRSTAVDGIDRSVGVGGLNKMANGSRDFFRFGETAQRHRTLVELHLLF